MENKNIKDTIKGRRIYLSKINAKKIEKKTEPTPVELIQDSMYKILENKEENVTIQVNTKVYMKPEALFDIEIEHIIEYIFKDVISDMEIEESIDELLNPLGSEVSFIISAISKDMLNTRIILPPKINLNHSTV